MLKKLFTSYFGYGILYTYQPNGEIMETLKAIHETSKLVSNIMLERLQVEESLLTKLVQNPKVSLTIKSMAFERISHINKQQLQILGASLK